MPNNTVDKDAIKGIVVNAALEHGVAPSLLLATVDVETAHTFDPTIRNPNSGTTGLAQLTVSTANQYHVTDRTDPIASANAAAELAANNEQQLQQRLGTRACRSSCSATPLPQLGR